MFLFSLSLLSSGVKAQKLIDWKSELQQLNRIDLLPAYRTNQVVEQISSYDRTGGNDDGFDGTYSYIRKENGKLVLADLEGPGVVNRIWTPTPTDDTLSFYFDGEETPRLEIKFSDLFSGKVFPFVKPISGNEIGGYYTYIPIPYKKSLKIVFGGEKMLFHQIQYRNLPNADVQTWTGDFSEEDRSLLTEVSQIWSNISPTVQEFEKGLSQNIKTEEKVFTIQPGEEIPIFESNTPGRIVGFDMDAGSSFEGIYKDVLLSATWDDEDVEAIYAPIADFFGYAYGEGAMRSMIMGKQGNLNYCYFPMPYDQKAHMKLIYKERKNENQPPISVKVRVYHNGQAREKEKEGRFYAVWKREKPDEGEYYTFLDFKGKGHYVGTIHQAQGLTEGMTLFFEGDDVTEVDGKMRLHGTGSEDYYNGGWYALLDRWDRGVSLPIHGSLDYSLPMGRTGGYRLFLSDKMSFEKDIHHKMEHGPVDNKFPVDYISLAFFYGDHAPKEKVDPEADLRVVYSPKKHVYFPQLMDLTLGGGATASFDRELRIKTDNHHMVRIMLNDVPEGKYQLAISYKQHSEGADFEVWQRQNQLTEWMSTFNEEEKLNEHIVLGDIEITKQTNSVTFHVKKNGEGRIYFDLERIYLERID